jgi:hypothetical protein
MLLGEEHVVGLLIRDVVRSAFALTTLVADDVTLVGEFDAVEALERKPMRSLSSQRASSSWLLGTVSK